MTIIDQLASELNVDPTILRASLALGDAVEALQPNYLTTTPDGKVGANFSGKIHAQGLDLDAAPGGVAPDQDKIRWLSTTNNGALIAEQIVVEDDDVDNRSFYKLNVYYPHQNVGLSPTGEFTLTATGPTSPNPGQCTVDVIGQGKSPRYTVGDSSSNSSFPQLASTGQVQTQSGVTILTGLPAMGVGSEVSPGTIVFPHAFPAGFSIFPGFIIAAGGTLQFGFWPQSVQALSLSSFQPVIHSNVSVASGGSMAISWWVIGTNTAGNHTP